MIANSTKRVGVLMSGGVDSSVAAALLQREGYDVVGVTLQLWDYENVGRRPPGERGCCDISHQMDARLVCHTLGIEHIVLDLRTAFQQAVVQPYERAYLDGRTPNPCIACNTHIKWDEVLKRAPALGFDFIATGHYARIVRDNNEVLLKRGHDLSKDQSYALWQLPREALERTLLPLGDWSKVEIRNEARRLGLRTAEKAESQEVCFINGRYDEHLRDTYADRVGEIGEGDIVDADGNVVGRHNGFFSFTIGQRRGLNISDGQGPYYVSDIDPEHNRVIVGNRSSLARPGLVAIQPNWVSFDPPTEPARCRVKIRYNDPTGTPAIVYPPENGKVTILFEQSADAVTPGQSAVWYLGDTVWGGGLIGRALKDSEAESLAVSEQMAQESAK